MNGERVSERNGCDEWRCERNGSDGRMKEGDMCMMVEGKN